jgi:di/tricarboxylate transporter
LAQARVTQEQLLSFAVVAAMMALFAWGRLRYDVVAVLALLAAIAVGLVPFDRAFSGFASDIVVIVGSALVVSAAIQSSGIVETALRKTAPHVTNVQAQIVLLVTTVTVLSALMKNIGALAMMIPAAFQMARRSGASPSCFLMPMAFGSLLGGIVTLVGTSPNIIVSRVREEITGEPFRMFDFAPVGIGLAVAGVLFLAFGYRVLPTRKGVMSLDTAIDLKDYTTEALVVADSAVVDRQIADLTALADHELFVTGVIRNKSERLRPLPDVVLRENDIVLLEGEPEALQRGVARAKLSLVGDNRAAPRAQGGPGNEIGGIEVVITPGSVLIGQTAKRFALFDRFDIHLLAVSRSGKRFTQRLRDITLEPGDVLLLKGVLARFPDKLKELGLLPLAERDVRLGDARKTVAPVVILAAAMLAAASGVVPVAIAFFAAAAAVIVVRALPLREAYEAVDWPILIMLGALIPVSESIQTTGAANVVAGWLAAVSSGLPPYGALALIMTVAMLVTPFLNNAATVLVMAPIAATFAADLGYAPDAFLMAVAIGAACDFLTPIGHQCNTLVMGPGGYRFGDYWRLGLPLSLLVVVLGVPLIRLFWPLT